jgi:hypothetical protein
MLLMKVPTHLGYGTRVNLDSLELGPPTPYLVRQRRQKKLERYLKVENTNMRET